MFLHLTEKDFDGGIIKVEIATRVQKSFDKGGRGGGRGGGDRGEYIYTHSFIKILDFT